MKQANVVKFSYILTGAEGDILDQTDESNALEVIQGLGMLIPAVDDSLANKNAGDNYQLSLSPQDAYGEYDDEKVLNVPLEDIERHVDLEVGQYVELESDKGLMIFRIKRVGKSNVTLDGNHPLAGESLKFDITIHEVREASAEEIEKVMLEAHVHDENCQHGHDHDHSDEKPEGEPTQ